MILTKDQEAALVMAGSLSQYDGKPKLGVLAGYAGTGKTTLLAKLPEVWGGVPVVVAPTGKAAVRVREATGMLATTIHSWAYNADEDDETGDVSYSKKELSEIRRGDVPILVIDEASMVGSDLWEDVYDTCCRCRLNILIVGDPFQLPPVQKRSSDDKDSGPEFNLLSPDFQYDARVLMTEIVRQALDNPIIRASMLVREGDPIEAVFSLPRIKPIDFAARAAEILSAGNAVVIVHKNDTRMKLNIAVRKLMNKPEQNIDAGEPLLVLQNNYRLRRFNGEVAIFKHWVERPGNPHEVIDYYRKKQHSTPFGVVELEDASTVFETTAKSDQLDNIQISTSQAIVAVDQIFGRMDHMSMASLVKKKNVIYGKGRIPEPEELRTMTPDEIQRALGWPYLHSNFGYVFTCHKAQGSEWGTVLIGLEPTVRLKNMDSRRWLYTAITRSREKVMLSLGGAAGL